MLLSLATMSPVLSPVQVIIAVICLLFLVYQVTLMASTLVGCETLTTVDEGSTAWNPYGVGRGGSGGGKYGDALPTSITRYPAFSICLSFDAWKYAGRMGLLPYDWPLVHECLLDDNYYRVNPRHDFNWCLTRVARRLGTTAVELVARNLSAFRHDSIYEVYAVGAKSSDTYRLESRLHVDHGGCATFLTDTGQTFYFKRDENGTERRYPLNPYSAMKQRQFLIKLMPHMAPTMPPGTVPGSMPGRGSRGRGWGSGWRSDGMGGMSSLLPAPEVMLAIHSPIDRIYIRQTKVTQFAQIFYEFHYTTIDYRHCHPGQSACHEYSINSPRNRKPRDSRRNSVLFDWNLDPNPSFVQLARTQYGCERIAVLKWLVDRYNCTTLAQLNNINPSELEALPELGDVPLCDSELGRNLSTGRLELEPELIRLVESLCPPECDMPLYTINLDRYVPVTATRDVGETRNDTILPDNSQHVYFTLSRKPVKFMLITFKPVLTNIQLLVNIAALSGIWFGISIYTAADATQKLVWKTILRLCKWRRSRKVKSLMVKQASKPILYQALDRQASQLTQQTVNIFHLKMMSSKSAPHSSHARSHSKPTIISI